MRLVLRNGIYHVHYYDGAGNLIRESTHVSDKIAAKRIGLAKERAASSSDGKNAERITVDQALTNFLENRRFKTEETRTFYHQKCNQVSRLLGAYDIHDLTKDIIQTKYIAKRSGEAAFRTKDRPVTQNTIHKELVALRVALGFLGDRFTGDLAKLIPQHDDEYKPRDTFLTPDQFAALKVQLKANRVLWCECSVYLGARKSEVEGLDWADLNWESGIAHLRGTKTEHSNRYVPIPEPLREVLFPIRKKIGLVVGIWRNATMELGKACAKAEIPRVTSNDLRRTYASWMIQQGVSNRLVADLLGHTTTTMVDKVYGKVNQDALRRATALLPQMSPAPAPKSAPESQKQNQYVFVSRFDGLEVD